jgi:hypothetical protein
VETEEGGGREGSLEQQAAAGFRRRRRPVRPDMVLRDMIEPDVLCGHFREHICKKIPTNVHLAISSPLVHVLHVPLSSAKHLKQKYGSKLSQVIDESGCEGAQTDEPRLDLDLQFLQFHFLAENLLQFQGVLCRNQMNTE